MATGAETNPGGMFSPNAFSQIEEMAKAEGISLSSENENLPVLEAEDVEGFVEMPFDIAALVTKYEGWGLSEDEAKRLAKLWVKPFQRILGKYKNADLYVALGATAAILTEKYVEYRIEHNSRARATGDGKDKLPETEVAPG